MVEIIPKKASKKFSWEDFLFYFSIILLIATVSSFFYFKTSINRTTITIKNLEEEIRKKTPEQRELEERIFTYQEKINDISTLLADHKPSSKVFAFLEENTHPQVWFSDFLFMSTGSRVEVSGFVESFEALGQQALIFKENPLIRDLRLFEVSIDREEGVSFTFSLFFEPQIFSPINDN